MVAAELAGAVALLLVPVLLLVVSLPTWVERRDAAVGVARDAAVAAAAAFPADGRVVGEEAARRAAEARGLDPDELAVDVRADARRGGAVRVRITVRMPALVLPGIGRAGAWSWTTSQTVRVDDHRSR